VKAADWVHVEWVEGEAVLLDPRSGELHYLNESAALLFALIQEVGYDAAVDQMRARFCEESNLKEELESAVRAMLEKGFLVDE
jgi:hypothetical protein